MTNLSVPHLDLAAYMREVGERARAAARVVARAPTRGQGRGAGSRGGGDRTRCQGAARRERGRCRGSARRRRRRGIRRSPGVEPGTHRRDGRAACARSPHCPIPSARSATSNTGRPASRSDECACRSASSASFTNRGRTSPPTPPRCASNRAMRPFCAAAPKRCVRIRRSPHACTRASPPPACPRTRCRRSRPPIAPPSACSRRWTAMSMCSCRAAARA